jgi:hypothetical protein
MVHFHDTANETIRLGLRLDFKTAGHPLIIECMSCGGAVDSYCEGKLALGKTVNVEFIALEPDYAISWNGGPETSLNLTVARLTGYGRVQGVVKLTRISSPTTHAEKPLQITVRTEDKPASDDIPSGWPRSPRP